MSCTVDPRTGAVTYTFNGMELPRECERPPARPAGRFERHAAHFGRRLDAAERWVREWVSRVRHAAIVASVGLDEQ